MHEIEYSRLTSATQPQVQIWQDRGVGPWLDCEVARLSKAGELPRFVYFQICMAIIVRRQDSWVMDRGHGRGGSQLDVTRVRFGEESYVGGQSIHRVQRNRPVLPLLIVIDSRSRRMLPLTASELPRCRRNASLLRPEIGPIQQTVYLIV